MVAYMRTSDFGERLEMHIYTPPATILAEQEGLAHILDVSL